MALFHLLFLSVFLVSSGNALSRNPDFYTAAVFEHAPFRSSSASPELIKSTNLDYYRRATEIAKSKGADFIVFPEYGIIPAGSRTKLKPFLETVPDPNVYYTNPCLQSEKYSPKSILYSLSCLAKNNSMVVVANMGDTHNCTGQSQCPPDGVFQFNTNVVFDRDGTLLVRYHKEHLFLEDGMDLPLERQDTRFHTDFGRFATYICFDIMFGRMAEVSQLDDLDGIMFPTMWLDSPPQLRSVQFWQAWSLGNRLPLFAANIQMPGEGALGSGVFHGHEGALSYTFNPDGISKLVVAKVPRHNSMSTDASITAINETSSWDWHDDGKDVPEECSSTFPDFRTQYHCQKEAMDNYTLAKLTEPTGRVEVCNNGMCCSLDYATDGLNGETFYLGVMNGTYNAVHRYFFYEETCVLTRCDDHGASPCSIFPMKSETIFHQVHLMANFTTDFVYPSVVENSMRLVPHNEWEWKENTILFDSEAGRHVIAVGFSGRCYDRDPPYKK